MQRFGCSERNALRIVRMSASTYRYVSCRRDATALAARIKEITDTRVHYGYRRVHVLLRREGHKDDVKRIYRLYREAGLSLRLKRPRRNKAAKLRQPKEIARAIDEIWSMDFVADALFDGRKLRMLTVVDCYTRECLAIDVGQSLKGDDVVDNLNRIVALRGLPATMKTDSGSEFTRR
jgi:putative transposase